MRDKPFTIRLTVDERLAITVAATKDHSTASDFVRRLVLNGIGYVPPETPNG